MQNTFIHHNVYMVLGFLVTLVVIIKLEGRPDICLDR